MRVLYIEDDVVDQLVCKKKGAVLGIELSFANSIQEAFVTLSQNPDFDLVISDFNLPDGTAEDLLQAKPSMCLTILSGEHSLKSERHLLAFEVKPISNSIFFKAPEQVQLNPNYINEVASDDIDFKKSLYIISKESIDIFINESNSAILDKNEETLVFQLHKIKSSLRAVGASFLNEIELLEVYFKSNPLTPDAENIINKLWGSFAKTKELIDIEISKLN